jgi:hypothetical protein
MEAAVPSQGELSFASLDPEADIVESLLSQDKAESAFEDEEQESSDKRSYSEHSNDRSDISSLWLARL